MNESYDEYVDEFDQFVEKYDGDWKALVELAIDKIDTEALTMTTSVNNPFQWGDIYDGVGQGFRLNNVETKEDLDDYVTRCCFPGVNCSDIDEAIENLESAKNTFDIESDIVDVSAGLASWNTEDEAVNHGGVLGVERGPAELFKNNYVETINPVRSHQVEAIFAAIERAKGIKKVVTHNRSAVLELIGGTKSSLDEYNPWEVFLLASMKFTFVVVGLFAGPAGGMATVAGDIVISKGVKELGFANDACVVELFEKLRSSVGNLKDDRSEVVSSLRSDISGIASDAQNNEADYVCKRPSHEPKTEGSGPPVTI